MQLNKIIVITTDPSCKKVIIDGEGNVLRGSLEAIDAGIVRVVAKTKSGQHIEGDKAKSALTALTKPAPSDDSDDGEKKPRGKRKK